jgi:Flp pilus assembly pilin Flp
MSWGHGVESLAGLLWVAVVAYLLALGARLVRAIERIATKIEGKPQ